MSALLGKIFQPQIIQVLLVMMSQYDGFKHGETLSYPGLEVCETATLARRSPETRAFPLLEGQAEDGDVVESQIMWFQSR